MNELKESEGILKGDVIGYNCMLGTFECKIKFEVIDVDSTQQSAVNLSASEAKEQPVTNNFDEPQVD